MRKQNEVLAAKVSALQKNVDRLQMESQQNAQHLTTARSALELQQEHLRQLQAEQQQAAGVNACINNLRMLDAAKQQWALEKNKTATDVPTAQDLLPYFKDNLFPTCPDGGTYTLNSLATCPLAPCRGMCSRRSEQIPGLENLGAKAGLFADAAGDGRRAG